MDRNGDEVDDATDAGAPGLRYDDWPVRGYEEEEGAVTYIGATGAAKDPGSETAILYDEGADSVFEANVETDERRFVPREGTEREVGAAETLGDVIEEFGDRLDWDSLSAFAREHLRDDDSDEHPEPGPEASTFTQSNVAAGADHDLEFTGSSTIRRPDDRVLVVERTFEVTLDDPDAPRAATVDVLERLLRAAEPAEERRAGDAEPVEERETTFGVDLDAGEPDRRVEAQVEERCRAWHESRLDALD